MRLTVRDVQLGFADIALLSHISFVIDGPSLLGIMGPSGSGKTTLLSAIAGRLEPQLGEITFNDADEEVRPNISWVFQSSPLLPRRTAIENALLGPLGRGYGVREATARAEEALDALGIAALAHLQSRKLSGGERQRVSIARGVAANCDVLLVDEPTAALDVGSRQAVCDALLRSRGRDRIVIVATHDPFVAEVCDVVMSLADATAIGRR